jgi:CubicO group peptidase (beta-lactamase class C family)
VRRTDPKQRPLGQFFHEEITLPMGGDMYIGLPEDIPDGRLAGIKSEPSWAAIRKLPLRSFLSLLNPFGLAARSTRTPKFGKLENLATRDFLRFELPSIGGVATARALAKTYSAFAGLDSAIGLDQQTLTQLQAPAIIPLGGDIDALLGVPIAFALGFSKPFPMFPFGSDDRAFGAAGIGGSQAFSDPATGLAFAYTTNHFVTGRLDDPRAIKLRSAIYDCLKNKEKK